MITIFCVLIRRKNCYEILKITLLKFRKALLSSNLQVLLRSKAQRRKLRKQSNVPVVTEAVEMLPARQCMADMNSNDR